jgi:uncharacterized membrane protein (DUF4010 family)
MTDFASPALLDEATRWPFVPVLSRIGMSVGIGLLIGLEREHSQKTGVRTFALVALIGCLGGLMGHLFAAIALGFVAMAVAWMNYRQILLEHRLALTTTTGLVCVGFVGVLFGQGHVFTPAAAGLVTAALLAWKEPITKFAVGLSDAELRSAILLAILTFIVYPVLPDHPVDPWGLIEPKSNWASVIIIAGIGFINYVLLKLLGPRGMEITAFFGGLVNSRKVVVELALRLRELGPALVPAVYRGIVLATGAMVLRNGLIVAILAPAAVLPCAIPLGLMLLGSVAFWRFTAVDSAAPPAEHAPLALESPFKLSAALKFGLVFLVINIVGALAERTFGQASFYFVSIAGGLLSSATTIAAATTLINHHELSVTTGANGVILSSLTSILINIPLIRGTTRNPAFKRKICRALVALAALGLLGVAATELLARFAPAP